MSLRDHNASVISRHDAYLTSAPDDEEVTDEEIEAEEAAEASKEDTP
jgi:hypothetical protein